MVGNANMVDNRTILQAEIMREKNRTAFITCDEDDAVLKEMLQKINAFGYSFQYLAELVNYKIDDKAARVIERFINRFLREGPRGYLVGKLDINTRENTALIIELYHHFQNSAEYISGAGMPAPSHIYTRYDNAFRKVKQQSYLLGIAELLRTPRDICYLPLTVDYLSRRNVITPENLFKWYNNADTITSADIGLPDDNATYYPPVSYFRRQIKFEVIRSLQYYPSSTSLALLNECTNCGDFDLAASAKKSLKAMQKIDRGE